MQREASTESATNTFAFRIVFNINDPSTMKFCSEKDKMQFRTRQLVQNKNFTYVILLFLSLLLMFIQEKKPKA